MALTLVCLARVGARMAGGLHSWHASPPVILSIAGYDPSSGAGVTADIKTAAAFGCYAVTCITALTVQSTQGVFGVEPVPPTIVRETLSRLRQDFEIAAVRIGMLGSGARRRRSGYLPESGTASQRGPRSRCSGRVLGPPLIDPCGFDILRSSFCPLPIS